MRRVALTLLALAVLGGCTKEQQKAPSKAVTDLEDRTRTQVTQLDDREQQFEEQVEP